jgi:RNA polymerase sigma factor (sigma-70 family)
MTVRRENGLGALPVGRVTWKGSVKSTRRAGTVLNEVSALASREKRRYCWSVESHSQGFPRGHPEEMSVPKSTPEWTASGQFPSTHWSRVVAAGGPGGPKARESLAALCNAYWYPLYAYIRRRGYSSEQAQDLTQDFFTRILEKGLFAEADPERGRFRSFLRTVCSHYLTNRRATARTLKRGGGRPAISIDAAGAEGRYVREFAHELTPERIFDRTWALTLLGRVFSQLRSEYEDAGRAETFEALEVFLTDGTRAASHASTAHKLGITEGAVRVAVHRLRRRYGDILRREIAATLDDPAEIDDEIQGLFTALET